MSAYPDHPLFRLIPGLDWRLDNEWVCPWDGLAMVEVYVCSLCKAWFGDGFAELESGA